MRVLHLYRPRLPSTRAQAIQVLRTCHALAEAGHQVTLFADRGDKPRSLWKNMGLEPHPSLDVRLAPVRHPGLAGLWFRRELAGWWKGEPGIVLARDKRRLLAAVDQHGKRGHRILLETHELDSLRSDGRCEPKTFSMEAACLAVSDGLVANCGGKTANNSEGVLVLGSMRHNKGVDSVLAAIQDCTSQFRWVGGTEEERKRYGNTLALEPAVPHAEIETIIHQAAVLLLPLGDNPFSHRFTSPLKLWDYLATDRPIVAAQTDAIHEICNNTSTPVFHYAPGDLNSIQNAIAAALKAPRRTPFQRPWSTRATELTQMMQEIW